MTDDDSEPLFAVEYDGRQHENPDGRARDRKKNKLCEEFMFPLARVRDEHIFRAARGVDYLTWLAELFFSTKVLEDAQANGFIPEDEPVDPMMFMTHPRLEGSFPLVLAGPARLELRKHARQGTILGAVPTTLTSCDDRGVTKTVAMVSAPNGNTFWTEAEIYLWRFGSGACDVTEEIATIQLESFVREPNSAHDLAVEPRLIYDALVRFFSDYRLPMASTSALVDCADGNRIRAVDAKGDFEISDATHQPIPISDRQLREVYPAPGKVSAPGSVVTPTEHLQKAIADFGTAVTALERSKGIIDGVEARDGSPLVESDGIQTAHVDAWRKVLREVDDALNLWGTTYRLRMRKNGIVPPLDDGSDESDNDLDEDADDLDEGGDDDDVDADGDESTV